MAKKSNKMTEWMWVMHQIWVIIMRIDFKKQEKEKEKCMKVRKEKQK